MKEMKDIIIEALDNAFKVFEKRIPKISIKTVYHNIEDIKPTEILDFITKNNIPDDAYFAGEPNGYDPYKTVCLCYDIKIPTTKKEQHIFCKHNFTSCAFIYVCGLFKDNGYKRIGNSNMILKQYNNTTVYDMYINKDFDKLVSYYSQAFIK